MTQEFDYIIIGSGFGGSVAAHRLTEKSYRVAVLESGKRFRSEDFPKSNWRLNKFIFMPLLRLNGILRVNFFKKLVTLSGAGFGGGSLVYANTLLEPSKEDFEKSWPKTNAVQDWGGELRPHYETAKQMLGATQVPRQFFADHALKKMAQALNLESSFKSVPVGVFMGEADKTVSDPYFNGAGPNRTGCNFCGGCMIGCQYNAKNTLDKNYLYFAEKNGATIFTSTEAVNIEPANDGYIVRTKRPSSFFNSPTDALHAKNVVIAAGTLGTLKLLFRCRDTDKTLPNISECLGDEVRTNSEVINGVATLDKSINCSEGLAITSSLQLDKQTKVEPVRYPLGSNLISLVSLPASISGRNIVEKILNIFKIFLKNPLLFIRLMSPIGYAKRTTLLLYMQSTNSSLSLRSRHLLGGLIRNKMVRKSSKKLDSLSDKEITTKMTSNFAKTMDGYPGSSLPELANIELTAHILGGCPIGDSAKSSVINSNHQLHGYPGIYVTGGGAIPANLGVNPSLTITAMAERAMAKIPAAKDLEEASVA